MAALARLALAGALFLATASTAADEPPTADEAAADEPPTADEPPADEPPADQIATADQTTPPRPETVRSLSLTISGGVSLGVYQAGFNYLAGEAVKRNRDRARLALITGASAGSGNGLITAIEHCQALQPFPSRGLGWKLWMDVGYRRLFVEDKVTATSVLTRTPLEESMEFARDALAAGLRDGCEVVLGFSVTRLHPDDIKAQRNLRVPRQAKKFAVLLRGRGPGRWPVIDNYIDPYSTVGSAALPFVDEPKSDRDHDKNWRLLRDLVFASASFPVAFPPVQLRQCTTRPYDGRLRAANLRCLGKDTRQLFVDGGVFDNNPLRYAYQLSNLGLRRSPDGGHRWRELREGPVRDDGARVDDLVYIYLDPDTRPYPEPAGNRTSPESMLVPFITNLLADFIQSARAEELSAMINENPDLLRKARLTRNRYPTVSRHLGAFLGFFDREFRRFDFYLGMYDAYHEVTEGSLAFSIARPTLYDFDNLDSRGVRRLPEDWRPFACLLGWLDPGREAMRNACTGSGLREFRILLQATLDRIYSDCRQLDVRSPDFETWPYHCQRAARGRAPPSVDGVRALAAAEHFRGADESAFNHFMRALQSYRFTFADLGLRANEAGFGRVRIRRKFLKMLRLLADAQDTRADRLILLTAGRSAVNRIAYEPPRHWWYFVAGGHAEVGASLLPFDWNRSFARLNVAVSARGLTSIVTEKTTDTRVSLVAGPEIELLPITTRLVQPIIGARIGYQLGSRDDFELGACDSDNVADVRSCSQVVLHAYAAVAIVERLRVQLTAELFPAPPRGFEDERNLDLLLGIGYQFF